MFLTNGEKNFSESEKLVGAAIISLATSMLFSMASASTGAATSCVVVIESESASVSTMAKVCPTCTISSFANNCSTKTPETSLGTSLSTLSVAISSTTSSASILSPTCFNQLVMVASATLSPIFGSFNSNLAIVFPKRVIVILRAQN